MNRRHFIGSISSAVLAVDGMSPVTAMDSPGNIHWAMGMILWRGYAARKIPMQEVIRDLHDLGLDGIEYSPRPGELEKSGLTRESFRDLLREKGLAVSGHYWEAPFHDAGKQQQILASFQETIGSVKFYGANNIIVGPGGRQLGDPIDLITRSAPLLNELGKIALDQEVKIGIHPHYNTYIEQPKEIHLAMQLTDPRYVFLSPDTGHIALGGGDVLEILRAYKERLNYFHFKDVAGQVQRPDFGRNLRELGRGSIDFPAVMRFLKEIKFKGWINQEQDTTGLTPRESAAQSMDYINKKLKA